MASLQQLHKSLLAEFSREPKNTPVVEKLLTDVKAALSDESVLKLSPEAVCTIHRDYFEISALFAIVKQDLDAFEKASVDLQSFYDSQSGESTNKYLMTGLHLMFLLVKDRLSHFHMMIEQIPQNIQQSNPYIITPVKLEQYLMEGAYNKVVLNEKTIPSPYYGMFIRILMDTVRSDIAVCIEKSYKRILIKDAIHMLLYDNEAEALKFAEKRGWKREKEMFSFDALQMEHDGAPKAQLETARIAKQAIFYAKQLEMIV